MADAPAEQRTENKDILTDPITGLLNREALLSRLEHQVSTNAGGFALLFLDLDDLKPTNDTLGHQAGNELLRKTGEVISANVRLEKDSVSFDRRMSDKYQDAVGARIHGDEFGVLLPGVVGELDLRRITERINSSLEERGIRASIGGRIHKPRESAETLLDSADKLMFERKKAKKRAEYQALPLIKRVAAKSGGWLLDFAGVNPPRR